MIVYADVLIVLNLIVDYFLLALTAKFLKLSPRMWRILLSAAAGAVSSLYIFLPQSGRVAETAIRLGVCVCMTLICFGFGNFKRFFRCAAVLLAVLFGYAGAMIAIWFLFRPNGMVINNSVVYFSISPLFLIGFSVLGYFIAVIVRTCVEKHNTFSEKCDITVFANEAKIDLTAIIDTGNSIEDIFGSSEIIIADRSGVRKLFGDFEKDESLQSRYRALPCTTVSGADMLDGYRCDKAYITHSGKTTEIRRPILAVSKIPLCDDYDAIINPKTLE